ncbi:MAG: DNA polymerase III subunit delta' [Deltaproteobacteria bacterium RBG_19FT_COMBO_60_16]|nr:MAG: DNA polymerase III subunit delta' [Deltaproteobacteria bacterium RBG_16_64_85]OGQ00637.1 MAG: DNA polymerase III subunit delta' [Deltaproteobacteria bacterium RBG_19FT_COMBO_60_16]
MVGNFSSLRGQDRAISLLRRYLETGNVPPGLLFHGEEGIGKERAALAFLAALFCRDRTPDGGCFACPECRLLASGAHPNLLRISPENHFIQIAGIRRLKEELSLKAFSDRARAALICPADRMTLQAANALLKTLEEPPPATHIVLVAHRLSRLPPTIVSRCQKIPFSTLSEDAVEEILRGIPEAGPRHTVGTVRAAAACAGGSPGRALLLLDEMEEGRRMWAGLFSRLDPANAAAAGETWRKGGERQGQIAVPLSLVRDLALLSSGGKADIINKDFGDPLSAVAARKTPYEWTLAFQALLSTSRLPPQAQKRLALEAFLFGLHGKD